MSRSRQKVSTVCRADFSVYDSANAPVTGLVTGDFTKLLSKSGADDATAVTVTEILTGRYSATFTPATTGVWTVTIRHTTYNKRGWDETFDVTTDGDFAIDDIFDKASAADTYTLRQILRLMGAFGGGKSSGGASDDVIRSASDSKDRITATIDANGHRTAVTLDLT